MEGKYNTKSPAVKRLMREAQELYEPTEDYYAQPLDDNLFEWHFTVRGPDDSAFEGGIYHGRILLPPEYPMKPPSIILLTPNGRFEVGKKICLSISGYHPESWQPSWSIRTALMAIIGFMPTPGGGAIGSLDYSEAERRGLAQRSQCWLCAACGCPQLLLAARSADSERHTNLLREARQLATEVAFQGEKPKEGAAATQPVASEETDATDADVSAAAVDGAASSAEPPAPVTPAAPAVAPPPAAEPPAATQPTQQQPPAGRAQSELVWTSNTVILVLLAAIAALLCRRLFLLDTQRLDNLPGSM